MTLENLDPNVPVAPAVTTESPAQPISAATHQQMLAVLNDLLTHTHIFYDDYGTACNCNCNCNCTRGSL